MTPSRSSVARFGLLAVLICRLLPAIVVASNASTTTASTRSTTIAPPKPPEPTTPARDVSFAPNVSTTVITLPPASVEHPPRTARNTPTNPSGASAPAAAPVQPAITLLNDAAGHGGVTKYLYRYWPETERDLIWNDIRFRSGTVENGTVENGTECLLGQSGNHSLVQDGVITINFYQQPRGSVTTFSLPKCLFATAAARYMFDSVDFSETVEDYRRRYNSHLLFTVHQLYRYIQPSVYQPYPEGRPEFIRTERANHHDITAVPDDLDVKNGSATVRIPGTMIDRGRLFVHAPSFLVPAYESALCQIFFNHAILFPVLAPCVSQSLRLAGDGQATLLFTPRFVALSVSVSAEGGAAQDDLIVIFGNATESIFVKAPYTLMDFVAAQTAHHDLLIFATAQHATRSFPFLWEHSLLRRFLELPNHRSPSTAVQYLQVVARRLLFRPGGCSRFSDDAFDFLVTYIAAVLVGHENATRAANDTDLRPLTVSPPSPQQPYVSFELLVDSFANFTQLAHVLTSCFAAQPPLLTFPRWRTLLNATLAAAHAGLLTTWPPATWLHVAVARGSAQSTRAADFLPLEHLVHDLYRRHLVPGAGNFTAHERHLLGLLGTLLPRERTFFLMQTSLCSPEELFHWRAFILTELSAVWYSPCMDGARLDLTAPSLRQLFGAAPTDPLYGRLDETVAATALRQARHRSLPTTLPRLACLVNAGAYIALTLNNATYVISEHPMVEGLTYSLTNTLIGKAFAITLVTTDTCHLASGIHRAGLVESLENVTVTSHECSVCDSVLLEYDEKDGITDLTYLYSLDELIFLTSPDSPLVHSSPRTHFLLLLNNGSVYDVSSLLLEVREAPIFLIISILGLLCLTTFGFYRLVRVL